MKFKKIIAMTVFLSSIGLITPAYAEEVNIKTENSVEAISVSKSESKFGVGQGILWPEQVNAPFVDMVAWVNKPDYNNNGVADLERISMDTGVKFFNLGFINSTGKGVVDGKVDWGWGGYTVLSEANGKNDSQYLGIKQSIKELRNLGGDVAISFGGLNGVPFWSATQDVDVLYNTYLDVVEGYGLTRLDLDIEGGAQNKENNRANAKAIKKLQEKTGVKVVLTLPVLPSGLTDVQLNVLEVYLSEGVDVEVVNLMTMCYGSGTLLPGENYGTGSLRAVDSTMEQLKDSYKKFANKTLTTEQAYALLGTTPSIGYEGSGHPIFTKEWSKLIVDHAKEKNLAMTSFWSMNRDAQLTPNEGVTSQYEFTNIFKEFGSAPTDTDRKPVIVGAENITVNKGDKFDPMTGVTANDKEDGDLTSKIKILGNVDVNKEGEYKLTYSVTDNFGNISTVTRVVNVVDFSKGEKFDFNFEITQDWGAGGSYKMTLKNNTGKDITGGWKVEVEFDKKLESYWNGGFSANGNIYTFTNPSWSTEWKAGETITIEGACQGGIGSNKPTKIKVNGSPIINNGDSIEKPEIPETLEKPEVPDNNNSTITTDWKTNANYKKGDIVSFNNKKYECVQGHTSLKGWEPIAAQSLWKVK